MEEHEELKILNNRSGLLMMLVKKNHMSIIIREGLDNTQEHVDAATFFDTTQARQIIEYLLKFIHYDGRFD